MEQMRRIATGGRIEVRPARRVRGRIAVSALLRIAATLLGLSAGAAIAGDRGPDVVELFTSQGCSSCPPANANLSAIAGKPGVLALSYGVTYWDYLGWKDSFAREVYTDRQRAYVGPLGNSSPYTPQVVVNGRRDTVGNRKGQIEALIAETTLAGEGPSVSIERGGVRVTGGDAPADGADVWLVRYDPRTVNVPIGRGENSGRTLPHRNAVRDLVRLGTWSGGEAAFDVGAARKGLKTAVLVQMPDGGSILAAATN